MSKDGTRYLKKEELTEQAIGAVIDHIRHIQEEAGANTISLVGAGKRYSLTLTVKDITE